MIGGRRVRRANEGERGQAIALFALAAAMLMGVAALAVDVGVWRYQQRLAQSAADSAAVSGANELAYTGSLASATTAATSAASSSGFTDDGGTTVSVTVNNPPASGNYTGSTKALEVVIRKKMPSFFDLIFATNQWLSVRAVATGNPSPIYCVYALGGDIVLNGGGGGGINAPTCGLITNQNLTVTGQANVNAQTIGYVLNGPGGGSYPEGQPMKSLSVQDPCPTISTCAYIADLEKNHPGVLHSGCQPYPAANPLPPGEYCTQLSGTVVFQPGFFVLDQGIASGDVSGTGVTIYNAGTGGLTFNGGVNFQLSAPTSGPTAGIAYYQSPSNSAPFTKNGQAGSVNIIGGFYAPSSDFTFNGSLPSISVLVAKSITMNGGGITVPAGGAMNRIGHGTLVE